MLVQQSALVRADSALRSVRELDRPDQIIGINTDDSVGVWLKERLTAVRYSTSSALMHSWLIPSGKAGSRALPSRQRRCPRQLIRAC